MGYLYHLIYIYIMINTKYSILNSGYVGAVEVTFIAITMGIQTSISWYRWPPIAVFTSGIASEK